MTLDKLVYDIREALKEYSDDSELDNRYIQYLIAIKRAKYLRQELDRFGRNFNSTILQTFCSNIEIVSPNECGLVDVSCDKVARTKLSIPNLLQLTTRNALYRVAPANKLSDSFTIISRDRAYSSKYSIFDRTKVFLHDDNHLYFVNKKGVYLFDCISITGVFEDPVELTSYKNCCDCGQDSSSCFDISTTEYPISPHIMDIIRQDVIKELAGLDVRQEDKQNNSQDDA